MAQHWGVRIKDRLSGVATGAMLVTLGVWLGAWLFSPPARAVVDSRQLLSGGSSMTAGNTFWSAPGLQNTFTNNFPATNRGERASQIRISDGGVLYKLRVRVTTENVPGGGSATVMVRINDADTALTCSVAGGTGECNTGETTVNVPNAARLAVRTTNNLVNPGSFTVVYSMLLD
jgi:hypothetical protein